MADDAGLKIIASLGVDYSAAITSMQDLANSAGDLNAQLAAIKASATQAGSTLDTSMAAGLPELQLLRLRPLPLP